MVNELDSIRTGTFGTATELVPDGLTLAQLFETASFDCRTVEEKVLAARRCDKSKAFLQYLFDRTFCHIFTYHLISSIGNAAITATRLSCLVPS